MKPLIPLLGSLLASIAVSQLPAPTAPAGNPVTIAKARLGKALFWDEQLSSTGTVSCGTCHMPEAGGADPRTAGTWHPGADGTFGTADDLHGSKGVPLATGDGHYLEDSLFGLSPQVTGRVAPSAIGAGYSKHLFWDGRAGETFFSQETGLPVLQDNAALESQAVGPILSAVEMGHLGRSWPDVVARVQSSTPLALSGVIPSTLRQWIGGRSYPQLFLEAFGSNRIDSTRIAMAIATYERTLTPDQTPWDLALAGAPIDQVMTGEEIAGLLTFLDPDTGSCGSCHSMGTGPVRFTDDDFHYIGVAPPDLDLGRALVTGLERDRGSFRTPALRNVALRGPYMHDGSLDDLKDVIEFYNRGGAFDAPNKHPDIRPLHLNSGLKRALEAFLTGALTDPRVAAGTFPFDRPSQYADSVHTPQPFGIGTAGSGGFVPEIVAIEPPKLGAGDVTLGIENAKGAAFAMLLISPTETVGGVLRGGALLYPSLNNLTLHTVPVLRGSGPGNGWGSVVLPVPNDPQLLGMTLYAQWVVLDQGPGGRFAASPAVRWSWF